MSASSNAMSALLAQSLAQQSQPSSYGGGALGPQMQSKATPLGTAGDVVQKLMLMRALQQQPGQPPAALPGTVAPQPVQAQQMPGGVNA